MPRGRFAKSDSFSTPIQLGLRITFLPDHDDNDKDSRCQLVMVPSQV